MDVGIEAGRFNAVSRLRQSWPGFASVSSLERVATGFELSESFTGVVSGVLGVAGWLEQFGPLQGGRGAAGTDWLGSAGASLTM